MSKRDNWFVNYQNVGNLKGQRDLDYRTNYFRKEDFAGNDVVDIGCNAGQMTFYSKQLGAKCVLGVDYDANAIKIANSLNNDPDVYFQVDDIDNYFFYTDLPEFDTSLLLSVIGTGELTNKPGILSKLSQKTKKVMYVEGHHCVMKYAELFNMILRNTTFTSIEYIGETFDNENYKNMNRSRSFFRCSREEMYEDEFNTKIYETVKNTSESINIVTGHGGSGKSYLKQALIDALQTKYNIKLDRLSDGHIEYFKNDEYNIIITDDVPPNKLIPLINNYKHVVVFDYRAAHYMKNRIITNLFHVKSDMKIRKQHRGNTVCMYNRSIPLVIGDDQIVKNIYHISRK